jgi:diguanylate cyclase (GGDEF)-like protein
MLLLVPVGFTLVALQVALGSAAGVSAVLFVLLFAWIGVAFPQGTALMALPLFAAAYLLPLFFVGRFSWHSLATAVYVGLACLVIGEVLAWLSSRLRLSQAAVRRARAVDDLVVELASSADPDKLWPSTALRLSAAADLPDCDIYRLTEGGGLICLASVYDGAPCPDHLGSRPEEDVWAVDGKAVLSKEPVLICSPADPRLAPAEREDMRKWQEQAMLIVPLVARDEVVGLVEASETREGRTIMAEQTATVVSACRPIAAALHNADLAQALEEGERRLASLHESSRAVAGAASLEEALAVITRCAGEALGVSECVAYEHEPELDDIVMRARWERVSGGLDRPAEPLLLADDPTAASVLGSGRSSLERISDPKLDAAVLADLESWGHQSRLTVAMPSADGPVGLLIFGDAERERVFPGEDLAVASALAGLAGEAVAGARLLRRLTSLSEADAMTGLASHRELHESLALEQARAEDHGSHFTAVMLGLDGLKSLNDAYGHAAGDDVLRQVAAWLSERTGARDVVGRWAGDKFLLILAATTAAQARLLAEELCAALAEAPYVTASGEQVPIRVSFGIAAYPDDASDASGLAAAADADLAASGSAGNDVVAGDERNGPQRVAVVEAAAAPLAAATPLQAKAGRQARADESSIPQPVAEEPAAPAAPALRDNGAIDQAEMRSRIEATRTRLKVKAFDAMIRGGTALLSQDDGEAPGPTSDDPGLDGDLEGMVDGAFSEQEY